MADKVDRVAFSLPLVNLLPGCLTPDTSVNVVLGELLVELELTFLDQGPPEVLCHGDSLGPVVLEELSVNDEGVGDPETPALWVMVNGFPQHLQLQLFFDGSGVICDDTGGACLASPAGSW